MTDPLRFWRDADPTARRALLAASLGWMLDAFDVMLYALVLKSVRADLGLSADVGRRAAVADAARLGCRRARVRRVRGPIRPRPRADVERAHLLGVHGRVRLRRDRDATGRVPHLPGHRHGRRVGERRRARVRDVEGARPRQGARPHAECVGHRLRHGRARELPRAGRGRLRLARGVLRRRRAGAVHVLGPPPRSRAEGVARDARAGVEGVRSARPRRARHRRDHRRHR